MLWYLLVCFSDGANKWFGSYMFFPRELTNALVSFCFFPVELTNALVYICFSRGR
jgi:hypothetical protein